MHMKRMNAMRFIKGYLAEKKKISKKNLKVELMTRFDFSGTTADRYISDIIFMGLAKLNNDHLTYVEWKERE